MSKLIQQEIRATFLQTATSTRKDKRTEHGNLLKQPESRHWSVDLQLQLRVGYVGFWDKITQFQGLSLYFSKRYSNVFL